RWDSSKKLPIFHFGTIPRLNYFGLSRSRTTVEINNDSGQIYIASMYKLLIYSSDFSFLEEKKFPFALTHLEFVKGELLVFSDKNGIPNDLGFMNISLLYKLSDSFTVKDSLSIRSVLLHDKSVGAYFFQHYISEIKDEVLFYKPVLTNENILKDTLFKIEGNKTQIQVTNATLKV
ncbi:hypothetical protein, partial [Algoriphagus boritolerans]